MLQITQNRRGLCGHHAYDTIHCLWNDYLDMLYPFADGHQSGGYFVVHRLYAHAFILAKSALRLLCREI